MFTHNVKIHHPLEMEFLSYGYFGYHCENDDNYCFGSYDCQFGGIKKGTWFLLDQAPKHQNYYSRREYPLASGGGSSLQTF